MKIEMSSKTIRTVKVYLSPQEVMKCIESYALNKVYARYDELYVTNCRLTSHFSAPTDTVIEMDVKVSED